MFLMFVVAVTVVEFWFDSAAAGDRTVYSSNLELGETCFEAPPTTCTEGCSVRGLKASPRAAVCRVLCRRDLDQVSQSTFLSFLISHLIVLSITDTGT